jgi:hypothetical protein
VTIDDRCSGISAAAHRLAGIPRAPETLRENTQSVGGASAYELGLAAQTGLRHRHRTLPEPQRRFEDHRRPFDTIRTGIEDSPVIVKILRHLGLPTRAPPRAPSSRSIPKRSEEPKTSLPTQADARSEFE